MNIVILYNKPIGAGIDFDNRASEEDTEMSAMLVKKTIRNRFDKVQLFPITQKTVSKISTIQADCILNFVEYTGRDLQFLAHVFVELRKLHIPYTGCSFDTYYLTTNKITMKTAFDAYHINSPKWQLFEKGNEIVKSNLKYPLIVKLAYEHCGVGLSKKSIVTNSTALYAQVKLLSSTYKQPIIVEEYIHGRELQVTIMDSDDSIQILPIAEYRFPDHQAVKILTYDSRWDYTHQQEVRYDVALASLSKEVTKNIESMCIHAYRAMGFTNYARFDLRLKGNTPYLLETNANPGLDDDPTNGLALSYLTADMTYADFLCHIIRHAMQMKIR